VGKRFSPLGFLYNVNRVSFPGFRLRIVVEHLTPSSTEVKGRVELSLYSPYGLSWPVRG